MKVSPHTKKKILGALLAVALPLSLHSGLECWRYYRASQLKELAHTQDHQGHPEQALSTYQQCLDTYPYFLDVHQEMAEIYIEQKRWPQALQCLDKALANCPPEPLQQAILYRQRGHCLLRSGNRPEARRDLLMALQLDPDEKLSQRLLEQTEGKRPMPIH